MRNNIMKEVAISKLYYRYSLNLINNVIDTQISHMLHSSSLINPPVSRDIEINIINTSTEIWLQ